MKFISQKCASLTPYVCGEQPQDKRYIKLNTNENPYPPSVRVEDFLRSVDVSSLRLYPDPQNQELKNAISLRYGVEPKNVFVGNGSDEILSFIFYAFFNENGKGVATADITYSFYPVYADFYNIPLVVVQLGEDFTWNLNDYEEKDVEGYIICNPNAPTGMVIPATAIIDFASRHKDKLVVVDEAYVDFCSESVVDFVKDYDNLLVVRTMSKSFSLAGIRCGYCVGNQDLITALDNVKNSFNSYTVDRLAEKIATIAINDKEYYEQNAKKIISSREYLTEKLRDRAFIVLPSGSNFLFAASNKIGGEELYKQLKNRGILVRHFNKKRIADFVRITIGTDIDCAKLIDIVDEILANN